MTKTRVLFTAEADGELLTPLREVCELVETGWRTEGRVLNEDELLEALPGCEIFVTSYDRVTARVLAGAPDLKLVICTRSTPVNVDVEAAHAHGIRVAYTPGRNSDATAEFAVALLLAVSRNLVRASNAITSGAIVTDDAQRPGPLKDDTTWGEVKGTRPYFAFQGPQLSGKNVGIVGMGSIGARVARIVTGFGAHVLAYDPYIPAEAIEGPSVRKVDFDELLAQADFISCHIKVSDDTRGMFDAAAFDAMKPTAYFINNSRGGIVVEPDLVEALLRKDIAGAALDVFEYEPLYAGHPFVTGELDNVLVTPHISGAAADAISNHTEMVVDEVQRYLAGAPLAHEKK